MNTGILLDRDGVLIKDRPSYVRCIEEIEILPGVVEAIHHLWQRNYIVCIVTNQSGVAKGLYSCEDVAIIHDYITQKLQEGFANGKIVWYFCPHQNGDDCQCRKPKPGMIRQAIAENQLSTQNLWLVGDALRDIQAGQMEKCKTALVLTGRGEQQQQEIANVVPDKIYSDLWEFVQHEIH